MGLLGSLSPMRLRCMALTILSIAESWPMMFFLSAGAISSKRRPSAIAMRCTGTPVIMATTSATRSASTVSRDCSRVFSHSCFACSSWSVRCCALSRNVAARSKSWARAASSFFAVASSISCSKASIFSGTLILVMCTREPASSMASMALSGKLRSLIYLSVRLTQASRASGV